MPVRTFDFCALQFLNQWIEKESIYCDGLAQSSQELQRAALVEAAAHFRIARNLPIKFESERKVPRYQPIVEVLSGLGEVTPGNVEDVIRAVHQEISSCYGNRRVLSLVTKILWLKFKSPVRIYDKQARIALGTTEDDFPSFNYEFSVRLESCTKEIEQACANLKEVISYTVNPAALPSEIDEIVNQKWFRERVLDIYLWNEGLK